MSQEKLELLRPLLAECDLLAQHLDDQPLRAAAVEFGVEGPLLGKESPANRALVVSVGTGVGTATGEGTR
jgi:hypothetical protein